MRLKLCLLALPLSVAACSSPPPPPAPPPVVINTPAPPVTTVVPSTPAESGLVTQCRSLFAQALGGATVNYGSPAVASAGGSTTVHLVAQPVTAPPTPPVKYTCSFSGTTLTAAGLS
jgi:hypothetical protein